MKTVSSLVSSFVCVAGLVGIVGVGAAVITEFCAEMAQSQSQNQSEAAIDELVVEFLAITPREVWPDILSEVTSEVLVSGFEEGARSGGLVLTPAQRTVVELVIVPRLKERMARSVERVPGYDAWHISASSAKKMLVAMEADGEAFMVRYTAAIARLLMQASDRT